MGLISAKLDSTLAGSWQMLCTQLCKSMRLLGLSGADRMREIVLGLRLISSQILRAFCCPMTSCQTALQLCRGSAANHCIAVLELEPLVVTPVDTVAIDSPHRHAPCLQNMGLSWT